MPAVVLAALVTSTAAASATPLTLAEPDQARIAALAQTYLQNRAQKVTSAPQTPGFGVPLAPALAATLQTHEVKLEAARASRSPHSHYRSAVVRTRVARFDVQTRDMVVAHVHEHGELYFEPPGTPPYTGYGLMHRLTVQRQNGDWVLADVAIERYKACGLLPEPQSVTCER
ncbi:hypothetical protein BBK82_21335 [Lentzea guizhouensis]|uniref:SnoaL-like domain-containing protein n=1 Tax=Lentzea guizhouensis TaxID=1586287 RepID=A0A1B2HKI9_9PSEU|nr:hypothetical protein BBK82_21335 [Lentzea guizhouensis]